MSKDKKFNPQVADVARELTGKYFRERREELGMTQKELAECAGIRQHHLSYFESGHQNVTINTLFALAGCLRLKMFFEEADPNTPAGFEPQGEN